MVRRCGFPATNPARIRSAWRASDATLTAFVLCGLVPLVPFVVGARDAFWMAAGATGLVCAAIGALKSRWSTHPWWRSALETLGIGGGAAAVAYGVGAWLRASSADAARLGRTETMGRKGTRSWITSSS